MTGTSLDGLDAALIRAVGTGLALEVQILGHRSLALPESLKTVLAAMAQGQPVRAAEVLLAARALGNVHAQAGQALLDQLGLSGGELAFAVVHGQTVAHLPEAAEGGMSWQLMDPWPVAERLGCRVAFDLRQADLIAGGQGAPITPLADWVMLRGHAQGVVNLGGIANVTRVGAGPGDLAGSDVVPCNLILDAVCASLTGERFDEDGGLAMGGRVDAGAYGEVSAYLGRLCAGHVTLGREQVSQAVIEEVLRWVSSLAVGDALRSIAAAVAEAIVAGGLRETGSGRWLLAGGGALNAALVTEIRRRAGSAFDVQLSSTVGLPVVAREAAAMAVLGLLADDGVDPTLPGVTGRRDDVPRAAAWIDGRARTRDNA